MGPDLFAALVLVCSGIQEDCTADTALDVIRGPGTESPITCAMRSQALVASLARPLQENEYLKIVCKHIAEQKAAMSDDMRD